MGNYISKQTNTVSTTQPSDIVCSSNGSCVIENSDIVESTQKFSCWDTLDPAWLNDAKHWYQIYVHEEILEWIVKIIHESILNENLRANVEEVHHHNLDGRVYLIQFYLCEAKEKDCLRKIDAARDILTSIKQLLKYKMPWKMKPTYFLRQDSKFKDQKAWIMKRLRKINLHKSFHATSADVNWLYIPKVEIYEFVTVLSVEQVKTIDTIFYQKFISCAAIYICDQFLWHREVYSYIELDKLAMDICVEQWKRHDLLENFSIEDILCLDLANKDYRDPDFNRYLDRYLNTLLKIRLPQIFSGPNTKIDVPANRLQLYLQHYFVSRFYDKISSLCYRGRRVDILNLYDIAIDHSCKDQIYLKANHPPLEKLIMTDSQCPYITYNISNYIHFSNSMFRAFLNKSNHHQTYKIRFNKKFYFAYNAHEQETVIQVTHDCKWTSDSKMVNIYLENCSEDNAQKLMIFVKYLINLFNERRKLGAKILLCFIDCMLDDYTFLENIGDAFDQVKFKRMKISSQQIKILSCALAQQSSITFFDCADITDNDLMTLLENIDFNRIWIEGSNACTPAIYFLMAEHLMNKEGVTTIEATRFLKNMYSSKYNFYFNFKDIEFFKGDNQIVAQNCYTKEIVDIYCLMNDIDENFSIYQDFRYNSEKKNFKFI